MPLGGTYCCFNNSVGRCCHCLQTYCLNFVCGIYSETFLKGFCRCYMLLLYSPLDKYEWMFLSIIVGTLVAFSRLTHPSSFFNASSNPAGAVSSSSLSSPDDSPNSIAPAPYEALINCYDMKLVCIVLYYVQKWYGVVYGMNYHDTSWR